MIKTERLQAPKFDRKYQGRTGPVNNISERASIPHHGIKIKWPSGETVHLVGEGILLPKSKVKFDLGFSRLDLELAPAAQGIQTSHDSRRIAEGAHPECATTQTSTKPADCLATVELTCQG